MQKKQYIFLLFASLLLFSSCRKMAYRVLYGVKKPKAKTEKQILSFLEKEGYSTENLYCLERGTHARVAGMAVSSIGNFTRSELYTKEGYRLEARDTSIKECWGLTYDYYKNLADSSLFAVDSSQNIYADTDLQGSLENLSGKAQPFFSCQDCDYIVLVYWASFLGKLSKQNLDFARLIQTYNPSYRIQVIQINMDFQKRWYWKTQQQ